MGEKKAKKHNSGMTLVELIIAFAVFLIAMGAAGAAFNQAVSAFATDKKLQDGEYNARLALLAISRDLHRAESVDVNTATKVLTIKNFEGADTVYSFFDESGSASGRINRIAGSSPVPFIVGELSLIKTTLVPIVDNAEVAVAGLTENIDRIRIILLCDNGSAGGAEIKTTITIKRIP